jgi:hypothetical protein
MRHPVPPPQARRGSEKTEVQGWIEARLFSLQKVTVAKPALAQGELVSCLALR